MVSTLCRSAKQWIEGWATSNPAPQAHEPPESMSSSPRRLRQDIVLELLFSCFPGCTFTCMRPPPLREGEPDLARLITPYDVRFPGVVDQAFAEVHDFIDYPKLVQVFIEFVYWASLEFAIAPASTEVEERWRWLRLLVVFLPAWYVRHFLLVVVQRQSIELPATTVGCEDTMEDFGLSL